MAYSPLARNLLCKPSEAPQDWRASNPRFSEENFAKNIEIVSKIAELAEKKGATPAQLSLAWLHQKAAKTGVTVVPIPGTTKADRSKENFDSLKITLTEGEMKELEELSSQVSGERGDEQYISMGFESLK